MKWYNRLYIGESVSNKVDRLKWKIDHNVPSLRTIEVHLITFASNPKNLLDIVPARELLQKAYPKKNMHVIGIAGNYDEAIDLVQEIIQETVQATGNVDVWNYLKEERGKEK